MTRQTPLQTQRAKSLRSTQTEAEGLLWSVLRGKQLCGMKFRRQHPVGPFFADFACVSRRLVVELDGGYHDSIQDNDIKRQQYHSEQGWKVLRFTVRFAGDCNKRCRRIRASQTEQSVGWNDE